MANYFKVHECVICDKLLVGKRNYEHHMTSCHADRSICDFAATVFDAAYFPVACTLCDLTCNAKDLTDHMDIDHPNHSNTAKCQYCDEWFAGRTELRKIHELVEHRAETASASACSQCGLVYTTVAR